MTVLTVYLDLETPCYALKHEERWLTGLIEHILQRIWVSEWSLTCTKKTAIFVNYKELSIPIIF